MNDIQFKLKTHADALAPLTVLPRPTNEELVFDLLDAVEIIDNLEQKIRNLEAQLPIREPKCGAYVEDCERYGQDS